MSDVPVLQVDGLVKHFAVTRGLIRRKVIGLGVSCSRTSTITALNSRRAASRRKIRSRICAAR